MAATPPLPDWYTAPPPAWFAEAISAPCATGAVDVRGCGVAYREWGQRGAPGVLLVHGFAAHAHWWDFIAPLLADGRHVAAIDLSGMGDSGHRRAYPVDLHVEEVLAVAATLGFGPDTTLVGHSYGGFVCCLAAARHPGRFDGIVMVDSPVRPPEERLPRRRDLFGHTEHNVYPTWEQAIGRFRVVPEQGCEHDYVLAHIARHSLKEVSGGWMWKFDDRLFDTAPVVDLADEFVAVRDRLTFIYGQRSAIVTARHLEYMAGLAAGRAPFIGIPDAEHHLFLNQPVAFLTTLRAVLAERRRGG